MVKESGKQLAVSDQWLSETVGFDCFNLKNGEVERVESSLPGGLITAKLDLSSRETPKRIAAAIKLGFRVVTFHVYFSGFVGRTQALSRGSSNRDHIEVRDAQASDEAEIVRLGQSSFSLDRFHSDPLIPREISDKIKGAWVGSFFSGSRGTSLTVAEISGVIRGFLLTDESNGQIAIDLIAVDRDFQGQGLASRLLGHKVSLRDEDQMKITAGTQLSNKPSLTFYEAWKLGPVKHEVVLHRIEHA